MPDKRMHRGPNPEDARLFSNEFRPFLLHAVNDLCWLLTKGYSPDSSLKFVGDRYSLAARQRIAVARCSASQELVASRNLRRMDSLALKNRPLWLDGYNVLTTIEAALGGGVILIARDDACRDMASMHGSYRKVSETLHALEIIGKTLESWGVSECLWLLDRPVSNSGRLKKIMEATAAENHWPWHIELVPDPDVVLFHSPEIVATADSVILDRCQSWLNLCRETIESHIPQAWVLDLREGE